MNLVFLRKPDENRYNTSDHPEFHKTVCPICEKNESQIQSLVLIFDYKIKLEIEDLLKIISKAGVSGCILTHSALV
jgi:hypothetical protein